MRVSFPPAVEREEVHVHGSEGCSILLGDTNKILHLLQFGPGAELPNHGIKLNSCSVLLVDIKKEKPFFNSEVERQLQASTKCHKASEIIGKADGKNMQCESQVLG